MPAYDASNWYALVFVVYIMLNLYVLMNIVLAVIYNDYKKHLKVHTWVMLLFFLVISLDLCLPYILNI